MAIVTSGGEVMLPRHVRDALGLEPGSEITFDVRPEGVILRKLVPSSAIQRWRGFLKQTGDERTTEEIVAKLRGR